MSSQDETVAVPLRPLNSCPGSQSDPVSLKRSRRNTAVQPSTSKHVQKEQIFDDSDIEGESQVNNLNVYCKRNKMRNKIFKLDESVQKQFLQLGYGKLDSDKIAKIVAHYRKSDILKEENETIISGHELASDAIVGDELSRLLRTTAGMINKDASKFDAEQFASHLRHQNLQGFYDKNCRDIFATIPTFASLCFLDIDAMPKVKKARNEVNKARSKKGEVVNVKGKQSNQVEKEDDQSLMETLRIVNKAFKSVLKRTGKSSINYYAFVIHPNDFGATIQNCFYVSFLLKDHTLFLEREEGSEYPVLRKLSKDEEALVQQTQQSGKPLPAYQCVNSMTYAKWRALIEKLNIKEPLINLQH
uniref:Non-structural maintenance of chromosomes element 4 n=1 Tax=Panagrolaimus sp. JU765 TaxID=591449 RepID=A0AC34R3I8_9BILA